MRVCIDTNVMVRLFGSASPFRPIQNALVDGRLQLALSTEILLEYQEVITRLSSAERWRQVSQWLALLSLRHGNIVRVDPQFRFGVIVSDPDDNKFVDCAIAAEVDYVITDDTDFAVLHNAGYKPRPISPGEFIAKHLG